MSFLPPPQADDVEGDLGPYSLDEIITARACLLHTVQRENNYVWQRLKQKMGILPSGQRLRVNNPEHEWIPAPLPPLWSAPVALYDPQTGLCVDDVGDAGVETDDATKSNDEQRERDGGERDSLGGDVSSTVGCNGTRESSSGFSDHRGNGRTGMQSTQKSTKASQLSSTDQRSGHKRSLDDGGDDKDSTATTTSASKKQKKSLQDGKEKPSTSYKDSTATAANVSKKQFSKVVGSERRDGEKSGTSTTTSATTTSATTSNLGQETGPKLSSQEMGAPEDAQCYKIMFKCDFCPFLTAQEERMMKHLQNPGHYSASKYLSVADAETGTLRPKYLYQASVLKEAKYTFTKSIIACPECYTAFADMAQCMSHSLSSHNKYGVYSYRAVVNSETLLLDREFDECGDCGEKFTSNRFQEHIQESRHMQLYCGQKSRSKMALFPCPFCSTIFSNYFTYKKHVFHEHETAVKRDDIVQGEAYTVGKQMISQRLLPENPGIPPEKIERHSDKIRAKGDLESVRVLKPRRRAKKGAKQLSKGAKILQRQMKKREMAASHATESGWLCKDRVVREKMEKKKAKKAVVLLKKEKKWKQEQVPSAAVQ